MHLLYCKQITYHLLWTYYIHPHSGNILLNNCIPFDNQYQNLDTDMVVHSHSRSIQQNNLKRCYIIFCFLEFYSLFVRMDYINIKKSSHSVRTSVYPKMILVFFSWELYQIRDHIARTSVHICTSLNKCPLDVMWFHADTCKWERTMYCQNLKHCTVLNPNLFSPVHVHVRIGSIHFDGSCTICTKWTGSRCVIH